MKYQVLFSLKNNEKYSRLSSAAVVISSLRFKVNWYSYMGSSSTILLCVSLFSESLLIKERICSFRSKFFS